MAWVNSLSEPLRRVTAEEYRALFPQVPTVFDSVDFALINAAKAEDVAFLAGRGMGIIVGRRRGDQLWRAPFSAPYASPAGNGDARAFARELLAFCGGHLKVTLPPEYRDFSAFANALEECGLHRINDFSFHLPAERFARYMEVISRQRLRYTRKVLAMPFTFEQTDDISLFYRVLSEHHHGLGYYIAMTEDEIRATTAVVPTDFFVARLEGEVAGVAMMDRVSDDVIQMIHWCDALNFRHLRPTTFIAYSIFRHYATDGRTRLIDLGPASTDGIPNTGLVDFKLSLGTIQTLKPTLVTD